MTLKMIVKKHFDNNRLILAVCDSKLKGKKFEQDNNVLDLSSDFYDGKETDKEEVKKLFKKAFVLNLAGQESVELGLDEGFIKIDHVINIDNIPHAQMCRG